MNKIQNEIDDLNRQRPGTGDVFKEMLDKGLVQPAEIDRKTGRAKFTITEELKERVGDAHETLKKAKVN